MNPELHCRDGLSAEELVSTLQSLLAAERTAMQLTCRYLADLADGMEGGATGALVAYADVFHAAECLFGLGAHTSRERIRVGEHILGSPPRRRGCHDSVAAAFSAGALGGTTRERHELAGASTPAYFTV